MCWHDPSHVCVLHTSRPPELLLEGQMSKKVDCYSFGVLVWEMYCGCRPFAGRGMFGCCAAWCGNMPCFAELPCVLPKRPPPQHTQGMCTLQCGQHVTPVCLPSCCCQACLTAKCCTPSAWAACCSCHQTCRHCCGTCWQPACQRTPRRGTCGLTWRRGWLHTHTHTMLQQLGMAMLRLQSCHAGRQE